MPEQTKKSIKLHTQSVFFLILFGLLRVNASIRALLNVCVLFTSCLLNLLYWFIKACSASFLHRTCTREKTNWVGKYAIRNALTQPISIVVLFVFCLQRHIFHTHAYARELTIFFFVYLCNLRIYVVNKMYMWSRMMQFFLRFYHCVRGKSLK